MKYFNDLFFEAKHLRREALEDARDAGRLGSNRLPDHVLFPAPSDPTQDLSDTAIHKLVDELRAGYAEREREAQS